MTRTDTTPLPGLQPARSALPDRRSFLTRALGAFLAVPAVPTIPGCFSDEPGAFSPAGSARLSARPGTPTASPVVGESAPGLAGGRDSLLYVPTSYDPERAWPLVVMLHGATGNARNLTGLFPLAESEGTILLVPESRTTTWDLIRGGYGPDVAYLDRALAYTFERCRVDPGHVALAGFSDGASYALSLGVGNGDLFSHLIGFSPGFFAPAEVVGRPKVYVSHGRSDSILRFDTTDRRIVPGLRDDGYDVRFDPFDGGHALPGDIVRAAWEWFAA